MKYLPEKTNMPSPKLENCAQYAAAPMTPHNLRLHNLQYHGPLLQHSSTEAKSIQMEPPPSINLDNQQQIQGSNGSYQTRRKDSVPAPTHPSDLTSSSDSEDHEEIQTKTSTRKKRTFQQPTPSATPEPTDNAPYRVPPRPQTSDPITMTLHQQMLHQEHMLLEQKRANFDNHKHVRTQMKFLQHKSSINSTFGLPK